MKRFLAKTTRIAACLLSIVFGLAIFGAIFGLKPLIIGFLMTTAIFLMVIGGYKLLDTLL